MTKRRLHVAIVGAKGAVGVEAVSLLGDRGFPVDRLSLFGTSRSAGTAMDFCGHDIVIQTLTEESFRGVDVAIFSAGSAASKHFAPIAKAAGCVVIDNSSAFRMDPDVPLVIPEINGEDIALHKGIIANPNCTTAVTLMAIAPLHRRFGVKRMIASSYQAVSGAGQRGLEELHAQMEDEDSEPEVFPHRILGNVIPLIGKAVPDGYTDEELKLQNEGRKILHHPDLRASITCVRIPVDRAHSISVEVEFEKAVTPGDARHILERAEGVQLTDDPGRSVYPMPLLASGEADCLVGRIRSSLAFDNGLAFFVSGDQLLKGAALNAVQIAEWLIERDMI